MRLIKESEALLQQLGVNSIETAKLKKEKLDDIHNDISNLEQQITSLSDGIQYDDLVAKSMIMATW